MKLIDLIEMQKGGFEPPRCNPLDPKNKTAQNGALHKLLIIPVIPHLSRDHGYYSCWIVLVFIGIVLLLWA